MEIGFDKVRKEIEDCEKLLIGIGEEWQQAGYAGVDEGYDLLAGLIREKDYFIVTMATDARIYHSALGSEQEYIHTAEQAAMEISCKAAADEDTRKLMDRLFPVSEKKETLSQRIVAPCGNETWRQCSQTCTRDIWEPGEIPDDICPHCGAPLTGNTIEAGSYIEEGYLPQWNRYMQWLSGTLNKKLLILELGVGFKNPGVIRFPFEKTAFFNKKARMYRVNQTFSQITEELQGKAVAVPENSVKWIRALCNQECCDKL